MSPTRRDFLKYTGATSLLLASSDLVGELIAQSPKGNPLTSTFKGLADIVLGEAKKAGCSYADVRFTRSVSSGVNASGGSDRNADGGGFGGGRGGRGGAGRGGGARAGGRPGAAGFGVRVIHSGVWGFASSPIVTEDELRRITRVAVEVARASAIAKKRDVQLAPLQAYIENYVTPMKKDLTTVSASDKQAWAQAIVDKASKVKGVTNVTVSAQCNYEWRFFASSEGSYIEQEIYTVSPNMNVTATVDGVTK